MKISTPQKKVLRKATRALGVTTVLFGLAVGGVGAGSAPRPEASLTDSSAQPPAVFVATSPLRVLDTRPAPVGPIGVPTAAKLGQGQQMNLRIAGDGAAIPANATAALINITIDEDASLSSFLTVWPAGEPRPLASANNAEPGLVSANSMLAKIGANGSISIFNQQGAVNVVIDVVGYTVALSDVDGGGDLTTGTTPPSNASGDDGDVYIDTTTGIVYTKDGGVWVAGTGSLKGLPGAASEFNTDGVPATISLAGGGTGTGFVAFTADGPEFGTVTTPAAPSVGFIAALPGTYEVNYELGITSSALSPGTVEVVVGDTPQGPTSEFGVASLDTEASGTILVTTTAPNTPIRLRLTNEGLAAVDVTLDDTSFMTVEQLSIS